MKNLIKRHLLLYFGNPSLLFLSLLGALISFLLYLLFLKNTMVDSWSQVSDAKTLLSPWLISGTLTVTAATTTFNGLDQMIRDRESGAIIDFQLTGIIPNVIQLTYAITAIFIGTLMQMIMFFFMSGYFGLTQALVFDPSWLLSVIALSFLSSMVWTTCNAFILSFVKKADSLGHIETILGTAAGFFAGVYLPIGVMPSFAQSLIKWTPFPYNAALYRQFLMKDALAHSFKHAPVKLITDFKTYMGVGIELSHLTSWQENLGILLLFSLFFLISSILLTSFMKTRF